MATQKKAPLSPPRPSPSEPEEEEESSEQESGEESEAEEESPPKAQSEGEEQVSESEEEEGDQSDSPSAASSPIASHFTVEPIIPKLASKDAKPTSKRASDGPKDDGEDSRPRKNAKVIEGEEKKEKGSSAAVFASGGAGRVWSEDDEIAVLEGMIDYQKTRGADPSADMTAFHGFVKGMLRAEMSRTQVYEKVRRLRNKFLVNVEKAKRGEDLVFSKPHESRAFRLSKKIWGSGAHSNVNAKGSAAKSRKGATRGASRSSGIAEEGEKENEVEDNEVMEDGDFQSKYPYLSRSVFDLDGPSLLPDGVMSFMKENLSLIDGVKAGELDAKWKKLRERETKFVFKWMTLMTDQINLVLDAAK